MTIKSHFEGKMNVPSTVRILGSGVGAATSDLTSQKGVTITRTGVGLHTVTLPKKFAGLVACNLSVKSTATVANWQAMLLVDSVASAGTFTIAILGSAVDHTNANKAIDLSTAEKLFIDVTVEDSAVKPADF